MIKINLAKASASIPAETHSVATGGLANFSPNDNAIKVVCMLVFIFILYAYQKYNISNKTQRFLTINVQATELQEQVTKFGPVTAVVEDLAKERKKLNQQMEVIQKISEKRAYKLGSIIALQESIPTDTWIEEMALKEGVINFKGYSRDPTSVQKIVSHLSELDFLESAVNKELSIKKIGKSEVHSFNIEARTR